VEQKKRSVGASERDEFVRAAWRSLVAREIHAERLVFVDEMGANISLAPVYAWSRRGERAFVSVARNWGKNVTLLASMSLEGMGPSLALLKARPPLRSSRLTWSGCWCPLASTGTGSSDGQPHCSQGL
jgi:hypothetical protein